jgi:hypothetical protein
MNHYILGGPALNGEYNVLLEEEDKRLVARCEILLPDIIFPEVGDISGIEVKITWVKED